MTHNATAPVDAEQSKLAAHAIKKRFDELNTPIKLNHAYEALAIAHHYPNWATMKAACSPSRYTEDGPKFVFGMGKDDVHLAIAPHRALSHIHAFSTSHVARRDLLMRLARNAIENLAALVFMEPVSVEDVRSSTMETILDLASNAKRSRDVFVLDISHAQTRLGNSFNVLADADDPAEIAELLMATQNKHSDTFYFEYAKVIEIAAERAIKRLGRRSGEVLTAEMLRVEIAKIVSGEVAWPDDELWRSIRKVGTVAEYARVSERIVAESIKRYPRYFDDGSAWPGPSKAIIGRNILLVLISREPGDFERILERMVTKAIKKSVLAASTDTDRYPDMLVCNDIDGFSSATLAEAARYHGICLVLGDQCQTLPSSLRNTATRFRSEDGSAGSRHYLLDEDGNRSDPINIRR